MKQIQDLKDLFVEQGRELYETSRQEENALPDTEKQANNPELKKIIRQQLDTATSQRRRLEQAFRKLNANVDGEKNPWSETALKETKDLASRSTAGEVRDAAIINGIQRLNHMKMSAYGSLSAYANTIGESEIAELVHDSLEEERNIDRDLSKLAEAEINTKANAVS
jgi:ferritin-like metal-binding protein YciE